MSSDQAALSLLRISPLSLPRQESSVSPWSLHSPHHDSGYSSLTLPPITSGSQCNFDDSHPRLPSPAFLTHPATRHEQLPPPSNQEAFLQGSSDYSNSQSLQQPSRTSLQPRCSLSPEFDDGFFDLAPTSQSFLPRPRYPTPVVDLTATSPTEMPSVTRKRRREEPRVGAESAVKQARTSSSFSAAVDSLKRRPAQLRPAGVKLPSAEPELVDLADVENDHAYADFKKKEAEKLLNEQQQHEATKSMKLSGLECVICMDPPTNLTVTHCGHLFCGECLHHALHTGNTKKACPVCRAPISTTLGGRDHTKQPKNGVFLMEIKLKVSKRKGKQPAKK